MTAVLMWVPLLQDETTNAEDPAKKGICSSFLCDAKPGAEVSMTGPTGRAHPL